MDKRKKQTIIFYIKKEEGVLYFDKLSKPFVVKFPKDVCENLEVVSKDKLYELFQEFIKKHSISPTSVLFILDPSVTFEKDITLDPNLIQSEEIGKYLEIVPFEKILSRVYKTKANTKVVAVNREFFEELTTAFEKENFTISAITPFSMLESVIPSQKLGLDAKIALARIHLIKQFSLIDSTEHQEKLITYTKPEIRSTRFIFLIGALAILLIILLVLIYTQIFVSQKRVITSKKHNNTTPTVVIQATPSGKLEASPTK